MFQGFNPACGKLTILPVFVVLTPYPSLPFPKEIIVLGTIPFSFIVPPGEWERYISFETICDKNVLHPGALMNPAGRNRLSIRVQSQVGGSIIPHIGSPATSPKPLALHGTLTGTPPRQGRARWRCPEGLGAPKGLVPRRAWRPEGLGLSALRTLAPKRDTGRPPTCSCASPKTSHPACKPRKAIRK